MLSRGGLTVAPAEADAGGRASPANRGIAARPEANGPSRDHGRWWGLIGLLPLLTAAVRFCPAYPAARPQHLPRGTGKPVAAAEAQAGLNPG